MPQLTYGTSSDAGISGWGAAEDAAAAAYMHGMGAVNGETGYSTNWLQQQQGDCHGTGKICLFLFFDLRLIWGS